MWLVKLALVSVENIVLCRLAAIILYKNKLSVAIQNDAAIARLNSLAAECVLIKELFIVWSALSNWLSAEAAHTVVASRIIKND